MKKILILIISSLFLSGCFSLSTKKSNEYLTKNEVIDYVGNEIKKNETEYLDDFYSLDYYIFKKKENKTILFSQSNDEKSYSYFMTGSLSGKYGEDSHSGTFDRTSYIDSISIKKDPIDGNVLTTSNMKDLDTGFSLFVNLDKEFDNRRRLDIEINMAELVELRKIDMSELKKEDIEGITHIENYTIPIVKNLKIKQDILVNNKEPYIIFDNDDYLFIIVTHY